MENNKTDYINSFCDLLSQDLNDNKYKNLEFIN